MTRKPSRRTLQERRALPSRLLPWPAMAAVLVVAGCATSTPTPNPRPLEQPQQCDSPQYPGAARRLAQEALVMVRFEVDAEGTVIAARLAEPTSISTQYQDGNTLNEASVQPNAALFEAEALRVIHTCVFAPAPGFDPAIGLMPFKFQLR